AQRQPDPRDDRNRERAASEHGGVVTEVDELTSYLPDLSRLHGSPWPAGSPVAGSPANHTMTGSGAQGSNGVRWATKGLGRTRPGIEVGERRGAPQHLHTPARSGLGSAHGRGSAAPAASSVARRSSSRSCPSLACSKASM